MKRNLSKSRVLVTGASSGIGRELTLQLAERGAQVLFTARRQDRLDQLRLQLLKSGASKEDIAYLAGDIAQPEHRIQLIDQCRQSFGGLDVVINNAGIGAVGSFVDADPARLRTLFEVNVFAAIELIRVAIPLLRDGTAPAIVNIGSVLAHFAVAQKSEYCATKFALRGFSDAIRSELRAENIDVISVHPNTTKSEFFDRLIEEKGNAARNPMQMSPVVVARKTLRAIQQGRAETVLSTSGKLTVLLNAWFPSVMRTLIQKVS